MMRVVVLVDGEHHPPAVRAAIEDLRSEGLDIVGAVFCGGTEKAGDDGMDEEYGLPVVNGNSEGLVGALTEALGRWEPELVLDLADEPVMMPDDRFRVASMVLGSGARYRGADFELRPPAFERVLSKPAVRVFATGKRTGKTTIASGLARAAISKGYRPVIVALGRGGPDPPRAIEAGTPFEAASLVEMADMGLHAASDYVEDAITSGATTIGCRRVGGGLAGATVRSNAVAAARMAEDRYEDLVILEGSGASFPEVFVHAGVICIPVSGGPGLVGGYLNPYRLLLADLAVVTMAEEASAAAEVEAAIRETAPGLDVVRVTSRPEPLSEVSGRRVFFCCTAPTEAAKVLRDHLETVHDCTVVGMTHQLADRSALLAELKDAPDHDVLLTEVKGAGIDVAARQALKAGRDVVLVDNVLRGDGVQQAFERVLDLAATRAKNDDR
jgi:cyclic 2,3-diphosphoglycerate synthetase